MTTYGYARVSTDEQKNSYEAQKENTYLRYESMVREGMLPPDEQWGGCFADEDISGGTEWRERDAGQQLNGRLMPGDTIIVTTMWRLFRNTADAAVSRTYFENRDFNLVIMDWNIDTRTPAGKMMFHIMAAIGEHEKDMIFVRLEEGRNRAVRDLRSLGWIPPSGWSIVGGKYYPDEEHRLLVEKFVILREAGCSREQIAVWARRRAIWTRSWRKGECVKWGRSSIESAIESRNKGYPLYPEKRRKYLTAEKLEWIAEEEARLAKEFAPKIKEFKKHLDFEVRVAKDKWTPKPEEDPTGKLMKPTSPDYARQRLQIINREMAREKRRRERQKEKASE